jgi:S1-C subfamily serine protease
MRAPLALLLTALVVGLAACGGDDDEAGGTTATAPAPTAATTPTTAGTGRPYLGITVRALDERLIENLDLKADEGALVIAVAPGSPGEKAGLRDQTADRRGDVIVAVDGDPVRDNQDAARAMADNKPGDKVEIVALRGRDRRTLTLTAAEAPAQNP